MVARTKTVIGLIALVALLLPSSAPAGWWTPEPQPRAPRSATPVVLLINGGGWIHTPTPLGVVADEARAAGFKPVWVNYPLNDLRAANIWVRRVAQYWRLRHREVFAYGLSAGGTMAALLAAQSRVDAAAVNAPPSDLLAWDGSLFVPGYWEMIRADEDARRKFSPYHQPHVNPVRVYHSRADSFVPFSLSQSYDAKFSRVSLVEIPGEHCEEQYARDTAALALDWLRSRVGFDIKLRRPKLEAG
jgi:acetyl esterase/lipase